MAQPEFIQPDFMQGSTEAEIHERMMANLPDDIDDMPGGFQMCIRDSFKRI